MTKKEIKKAIETGVKFYEVINNNFYEERDLALKEAFGKGFGYTENEETYKESYTIDGVTYTDKREVAKAVYGIKTSDDYNDLLKELTDRAVPMSSARSAATVRCICARSAAQARWRPKVSYRVKKLRFRISDVKALNDWRYATSR